MTSASTHLHYTRRRGMKSQWIPKPRLKSNPIANQKLLTWILACDEFSMWQVNWLPYWLLNVDDININERTDMSIQFFVFIRLYCCDVTVQYQAVVINLNADYSVSFMRTICSECLQLIRTLTKIIVMTNSYKSFKKSCQLIMSWHTEMIHYVRYVKIVDSVIQ